MPRISIDRESVERLADSCGVDVAATLRALLAKIDAVRAHVESERDIVHSLQADAARWRDECERLRLGGCARGQTTTQWCAEAVEMMAQRDAARASVAAAYRAGAEAMRAAIKESIRAYPFDLKNSGPRTDALAAVDATPLPEPQNE